MKKSLLLLLALALVGGTTAFFWWKSISLPANPQDKTPKDFLVTRGQGLNQVSSNLEKQGLIKNKLAFKFYMQLTGQSSKIQAGEYSLAPSYTLDEIMVALTSGPKELWVTYPEGLRREEIAAKTIKDLKMKDERAQTFWTEFMQATEGQEGYLFPETYLFSKDISAKAVATKFKSTFDQKVTAQMKQDAQKSDLSFDELLVLASILERESRADAERPTVAGVLLNRLEADWPLQADATLQYSTGTARCAKNLAKPILDCDWWNVPTADDKTVRSAYNTYTNPGLPPYPIANPSLSSIKAVIYPEKTDYWFYIHDNDGKIHFARTIDEHNANINKYLR